MSRTLIEPADQDPELLNPIIVSDPRNYIAPAGEDGGNDELESLPLLSPMAPATKLSSAWWIIIPCLVTSISLTIVIAPMIQFYTQLFCNQYYQSRGVADDIPYERCQIPEIQAMVSNTQAIIRITASISALLVTGYYGALSDRMGRKFVLRITVIGSLLDMVMMILTQKFQDVVGIRLLYVAPVISGLCGGWSTSFAASQAYISDCTEPADRAVMFGRLISMFFIGGIIGPSLGSIILKFSGEIIHIFYFVFCTELVYLLYIFFVLPESNHRVKRSEQQQQQQQQQSPLRPLRERLNFFSGLGIIFRPQIYSSQFSSYTLPIIALVHFLSIVVMPFSILIMYAMFQFHWTSYRSGIFFSMSSAIRVVILLGLLPLLVRWFKGTEELPARREGYERVAGDGSEDQEETERKRQRLLRNLNFDAWVGRLGYGFEVVALILFGIAPDTPTYFGASAVGAMSSIAYPSIRSLLTNLVPPTQIGELLGAISILDAIGGILNPLIMNSIYSATVNTMPNLIFFFASSVFAVIVMLMFLVRPSKLDRMKTSF